MSDPQTLDQDPPEGGSYTRLPDGSLVRTGDVQAKQAAAPQEQPAETE